MYLFIFGCPGSSVLHGLFSGFSECGPLTSCGLQASDCRWLSCRGAGAPGHAGLSVVRGLSGCGSWALEHRLDS